MKNIFKILAVLLFLYPVVNSAQETYGTAKGVIYVKSKINDNAVVARSNDLAIDLNYETAEFILRLDISSLSSGIDSLDRQLQELQNGFITVEGSLGMDYIKTEKHEPLDFVVKGHIDTDDGEHSIVGDGRLVHVFGDYYSCVLSMNFNINWKESGFDLNIPGLDDIIRVRIIQTLLVRGK